MYRVNLPLVLRCMTKRAASYGGTRTIVVDDFTPVIKEYRELLISRYRVFTKNDHELDLPHIPGASCLGERE